MSLPAIGAWLALALLLAAFALAPGGLERYRWLVTAAVVMTLAASLALAWGAAPQGFPHWQGALVFDDLAHFILPPLWTGISAAMLVCLFLPGTRYDLPLAALSTAASTAGILSANPLLAVTLLQASALLILAGLVIPAERPGGNALLSIATALKYITLTVLSAACLVMALLLANFFALNQDRIELPRIVASVLVIGFGLAVGAMPFYFHLPDICDSAPPITTAAMLGPLQALAFVYLIRTIGNGPWLLADDHVISVLAYGAAAGSTLAAILAVGQRRLQRVLAFNAIREIGWLALGIGSATRAGWNAALILLAVRCLGQPLLVSCGALFQSSGDETSSDGLAGAARLFPVATMGWCVGVLASVGFPPAASFWGVEALARAALLVGWPALVLLLGSGLLALWRFGQLTMPAFRASAAASAIAGGGPELPPIAGVIGSLAVGLLLGGVLPRLFTSPVNDVLSAFAFLR